MNLNVAEYVAALLKEKIPIVEYNHISVDKRVGTPITKTVQKKALNPIYYKGCVQDDLVQVKPLRNPDGSYL